jgi:hypothetical protein
LDHLIDEIDNRPSDRRLRSASEPSLAVEQLREEVLEEAAAPMVEMAEALSSVKATEFEIWWVRIVC